MRPSRVEFHILLALSNGPRHGYGVMQDVKRETDGSVKLGPGTLYSALKRFLEADLVEECEPDSDRQRCYRLTRKGRRALIEEAQRIQSLMRLVRTRGLLRHA